jgi:hypothetical protein
VDLVESCPVLVDQNGATKVKAQGKLKLQVLSKILQWNQRLLLAISRPRQAAVAAEELFGGRQRGRSMVAMPDLPIAPLADASSGSFACRSCCRPVTPQHQREAEGLPELL